MNPVHTLIFKIIIGANIILPSTPLLLSCLWHLSIRVQFYTRFSSFVTYSSIPTFLNFTALILFGEGQVLWKASSFLQGCAHPYDTGPLSAHLNNLSRFLWKSKMVVTTKITTETRVDSRLLPDLSYQNFTPQTMAAWNNDKRNLNNGQRTE